MKNIDIVKIICKELGKPESLITYVTDRKGHDMRYAIDPTKIHNELGCCQKPNLQTVSRRPSSGILTTRNGGRPLFPESIRITTKKCTATAKEGCFYETVCNRCGRSAWS